jgi:hypothetical protein
VRHPYERSATADDIIKSFHLLAEKLNPSANKHDPNAAEFIKVPHEMLGDEAKGRAFGGRKTFRQDEFDDPMPKEVAIAILGVTLSVTGLLVALAIMVASPLITRSLMPLTGIIANEDGGGQNSSRARANEERVLAAKPHRGPAVPSEPHLVLQQSASYVAADSIPLGIRVDGKADGMALEISDLPTGATISSGRPLGTGAWRILATDAGKAVIHLPSGFSGTIDLTINLRLLDDTVVDRRSLHLEWPQKPIPTLEPIESAGAMAASVPVGPKASSEGFADKSITTVTPTDRIAALDAIEGKGDHDSVELLIGRSEMLLSEGQVETARLLLLPAAEAHDAAAALALGASYDPIMLAIFQAHGVAADVSAALDWYKKASELGSQEARQRLNLLTAAFSHSKYTGGIATSDKAPPKVMASPLARPKGHVARAPTRQHRPYDRYRVEVAGAGTVPDPLLSPPAFIQ